MRAEKFSEAMNEIDDKYIEKAISYRAKKRMTVWISWGVAAACVCLIVAILWNRPAYDPPVYEGAYLSAEDVGKMFGLTDNKGATSSYTEVYYPEDRPLPLQPLPTEAYADIYTINKRSKAFSEAELNDMIDTVMPKLTAALGTSVQALEKHEYNSDLRLMVSYRRNGMMLDFEQTGGERGYGMDWSVNRVWIYNGNRPLVLNGKTVQVDQRQSEQEMLASLEWVRDLLFEIFDCELDSVKVVYDYGETHEYGIENLYIYYYNESEGGRRGDYIELSFDNYANSSSETESADIISRCNINYYSFRIPVDDYYTVEAKCKLISLETAEELLANGYVFGGHSCPICMADQAKVSFEEYDYVSFEYISDPYSTPARSIPFYAFYKKIGVAENGNIIYAKTYVCAVEVSGLQEYYAGQKEGHGGFWGDIVED